MNTPLLYQGLTIGAVLAIAGLFSAIYHMDVQILNRIALIEASTRTCEESGRQLQIRMSHLEAMLLNYDHGPPLGARKAKE
jgi:hypothetical protein